jgi:hypothetical protein
VKLGGQRSDFFAPTIRFAGLLLALTTSRASS